WLLTAGGVVRALGAAPHLGDATGRFATPAVAIGATPTGAGYYVVAADGQVAAFGDARAAAPAPAGFRVTGLAVDPDGFGYWMVTGEGYFLTFQEQGYLPHPGPPSSASTPFVAAVAIPPGGGGTMWAVTSGGYIRGLND